jgi:hypothetical protein
VSEFRYAFNDLRGDYIRAGIGLVLTLGPAASVPFGSGAHYVLLPAAALFLIFGWRTWQRQKTRVVIDLQGISLFSRRRVSLPWKNIQEVRLSYYSLKADRSGGWMQLMLKGRDPQQRDSVRAIRLDSTLSGFEQVVRRAAEAAAANDLDLTPATRVNFEALGIAIAEPVRAGA